MASDLDFVKYVVEQINDAGKVTYRKMFGEYGLYIDGVIMALICDDQLFVKPTLNGRTFIGNVVEAPPYPGAKPYFLIDRLDDNDWISRLVRETVKELSEEKSPKAKHKRR